MSDLNDFLKVIAEAKAKDPKHQAIKQIKETVKEDVNDFFKQLTGSPSQQVPVEKVDDLVEKIEIVEQAEMLDEVAIPSVKTEDERQAEVLKLLKKRDNAVPFQQPDPDPVSKDIKAITDKLKFMEQWLGKITAAGPGSGEVNFRYLDDVNRATMTSGNDNWVLEYDSATGKVQFTENIGAIRTILFNQSGSLDDLLPGQLAWNPDEDCLDIRHADGTTLQTGLEQHIQVYNGENFTLENGSVVRFSGVNGENGDTIVVAQHIADGTIPSLYTVGVTTLTIASGGLGRVTTFGKVRNIDTTGASSGEQWQAGDILYVSPNLPGKLTKIKPTAPDVVISVAAVLRVGATDGILFVRPTIFPRLYYASLSDTTNQTLSTINTPKPITYNTVDIANGHHVENGSRIVAENSGLYNYQFSIQLVSTNSSAKEAYIWARKNGVDMQNSATRITIVGNDVYTVAAWNFIVSMNANDYFELVWAASDTAVSIVAPPATAFCPSTPSVILTVTEAAL